MSDYGLKLDFDSPLFDAWRRAYDYYKEYASAPLRDLRHRVKPFSFVSEPQSFSVNAATLPTHWARTSYMRAQVEASQRNQAMKPFTQAEIDAARWEAGRKIDELYAPPARTDLAQPPADWLQDKATYIARVLAEVGVRDIAVTETPRALRIAYSVGCNEGQEARYRLQSFLHHNLPWSGPTVTLHVTNRYTGMTDVHILPAGYA